MRIREVSSSRDIERFIRLPWRIYAGDANWPPPLLSERRRFLDSRSNPFFRHAEVTLFLAEDERGVARGRLAAIVNRRHIETHREPVGFFGLFECENDPAVASALFDAAANRLRERGLQVMRGPENLSVNDDIGLLVDGFDRPPTIMMPYNPAYYPALVEGAGFRKAMDLLAYWGDASEAGGWRIPAKAERGVGLCMKRYGFRVRPLDMRHYERDLEHIRAIYARAWSENWGAVALTPEEFLHLARELKPIVRPELCLFAEIGGVTAGFSLALPDFNQVLSHLNGRLFPFGFLKLLWYRRRIDTIRILTLGVLPEYRHMGMDNCFYYETYRRAVALGMPRGEMSWILETNAPMNNAMIRLGFRPYKRYRIYDRPL